MKVTKRERFEQVKAVLEAKGEFELVEFVDNELELLAKRNGKARGLTKTQKDNEVLKGVIVEVLAGVEDATATDVAKALGEDVTVQKAAQLLRQLVAAGVVAKTEAKGKEKAKFALA